MITSFAPAAATITVGSSTTLKAVFTNGTGSVDNGVGVVTSNVATPSVSPATTTTYTLTVTNSAGTQVTQQTTITVVPPPVITSFTASPTMVVSGGSVTLTPVFTGGTGVITNNVDSTSIVATTTVGAMVSPLVTTTYTLTVGNQAGSIATSSATVTVTSPPVFTSAASTAFIVGSNSTFLVTTTGNPLPTLSVSSLPPSLMFADKGNGTATISGAPVAGDVGPHQITITASNSAGTITQNFTLTVNGGPAIVTTNVPFPPPIFAGGSVVTIGINVTPDAPGDVVTAALTVDANTTFSCTTTTCGTLPGGTLAATATLVSPGHYTLSYTPPPSAGFTRRTVPTLVVSSNLNGSIGATDFIEVNPAGTLVTISGAGRMGTVFVGANPSDVRTLTATVYNDTRHLGVTLAPLTASGYACSSLSPNSCGTLAFVSSSQSGSTTTATITYTPPASLPSAPYDKPRIEVISAGDPTRSASIAILLSNDPVAPAIPTLWISRNSKFKTALIGTAQTLSARILNDTGTNLAVNWTLNCSPACGTLGAPTTVVSGGTTVDSAITYTPPSSVPTLAAGVTPTITATSADTASETDNFTFNIFDPTCGKGNEKVLNGQYAFLVRGGGAGGGYGAVIGSFTAHGDGTITGGSLDANNGFGPFLDSAILTAATGSLPASSYSVGADNRGCLTLSDSSGGLETFRFAVGTLDASNVATEGRIIRFDDTSWRGRAQSGVLMKQDPTSFNASSLSGTYAFGEVGVDSNGGRFAGAGLVTSDGAGVLSNFSGDFDDAGTVSGPVTGGSGSYTISPATGAASGRGTATTTFTVLGKSQTGHIVLYMVSSSEALFMTTGNPNTEAILSGELKKQTGPFTQNSLDGKDYVLYVEGIHPSDGGNDTVIGQSHFAAGAGGAATITLDENKSGLEQPTQTTAPAGVPFTIGANGRTTIPSVGAGGSSTILYLVDASSAFVVGTDNGVAFGYVEQQTGGLSTASFSGPFFFGGDAPTTGSQYQSGTVTLSAGNANGNGDHSGPNGLGTDTISPANGGAYSFSSSTVPVGKGTVGTNSIAYAVSASRIIFMSTGTDVDLFAVQK